MTKAELRLALIRLVWPDGPDRRQADASYYMAKAEELERWVLSGGYPETDPQDAKPKRGRPRKNRDPETDTSEQPNIII